MAVLRLNIWLTLALLACSGCSDPGLKERPLAVATASPAAVKPDLEISWGKQRKRWSHAELLQHSERVEVTVEGDAAYRHASFTYQAIPLHRLFEGAAPEPDSSLAYQCQDGFASNLPAPLALNSDPTQAVAYLAVESPDQPWPPLEGKKVSAGPYYLIWSHPERSGVGREQWPFQLKSLALQPSLAKLYPRLLPPAQDARARRGYDAFVKNCFPCHTLNHQGASQFGPDLNQPMNPTRYFAPDVLKKFIRDPRSVRSWPGMQMVAFGPEVLTDPELDDLVHYLGVMAAR